MLSVTFSFTVFQHEYYTQKAAAQQKRVVKNAISRGTIKSSEASLAGVIGVSTNLGTLAIDPTQKWSKDKLLSFLADAVLEEFCTHKSDGECISSISNYTRSKLEDEDWLTKNILKKTIITYLKGRMESPIESVFLKKNVGNEDIEIINSWDNEALFFVVNNLYVNPTKVQNKSDLGYKLTELFWGEQEQWETKFKIRKKQHLEILRKMSIGTRDMVNLALEENDTLVENMIEQKLSKNKGILTKKEVREDIIKNYAFYPFIKIEDNLVRYYPEGNALWQITGFVDNEWLGRYGIEWYFENELQKESPTRTITKDLAGRPLEGYASGWVLSTKNGTNITLTIDRNVQKELTKRLEWYVKRFRANEWSVIVMDPKTGAIIAMANYPDYDPNNFTDVHELEPVIYARYKNPAFDLFGFPLFVIDSKNGTTATNIEGKRVKIREATLEEVENFAIQKYKYKNGYGVGNYKNNIVSSLYEPGSVFKAFTVAIGIDAGEIKADDTYYDKNYVELDYGNGFKQRINNLARSKCGGWHTYQNALSWSCNVGMVNIIEKVWRSLFEDYLRDFWFGVKTNITLDGEVFSQIAPNEKWSRMQFFTMSFWQGISATMVQMAAAYSTLANGGVYMQPYIVESMEYPDGRKIQSIPTPLRRVISEESSKAITAMLVQWVRRWFASAGGVAGYAVAGKTGTSQIPYKWTYENKYFRQDLGHTTTSFGGYAPAYNPKFVMIVRITRPRTEVYAEKTASAMFANMAEYLLKYYKVPQQK